MTQWSCSCEGLQAKEHVEETMGFLLLIAGDVSDHRRLFYWEK